MCHVIHLFHSTNPFRENLWHYLHNYFQIGIPEGLPKLLRSCTELLTNETRKTITQFLKTFYSLSVEEE